MAKLSNDIKSQYQASQNHENVVPDQSSREQITELWKPKARVSVPESSEPARQGRSSQYLDLSKNQPTEPDSTKVKLIKQEKQPKALSSSGFMALKKNSYRKPQDYEPVTNEVSQSRPNASRPPVIVNKDLTSEPNEIYIEKTKPRLRPKLKPKLEREQLPEQKRMPGSEPEPVRVPIPEPVRTQIPEPVRTPIPEPVRTPIPELVRTPIPEPKRTPVPEPKRTPIPEPKRTPVPEPKRTPIPEPKRTPTPDPEHNQKPVPELEPVRITEPESIRKRTTEPEPKRKPTQEPKPKRKPKPEPKQTPQSKRKRKPKLEDKSNLEQKPKPNRKPKQKLKPKRTPARVIANILFYMSLVFILFSLVVGYHNTVRPIFINDHTIKSVVTNCLEEDIPQDSLVVIERVNRNELVAGDAITFYLDGQTVRTQRITEVHTVGFGELAFGTSGFNATHDFLIPAASVIGRVVLFYPDMGPLLVGIPNLILNTDYFLPVLGAYVGILVLVFFLRGLFSKGKRKKPRKRTARKEKSHAQMS